MLPPMLKNLKTKLIVMTTSNQILSNTQARIAQYKCLNDLLFHTRYFFKKAQHRKFVVGDHHEIICAALERVLRGELKRLIINIAPRYGKTELAVKSFISHGLALNAAAKFIHLSYSDMLALDNSEAVKDLIESPEYQELFSNVKFKPGSAAKKKWYTTEGGGVYATSAAGQVTGFGAGNVDDEDDELMSQVDELIANTQGVHTSGLDNKFKFGGALIIDDPIKPDDADSDLRRERVNNRFETTIRNRVNSRNTPIVIIMQRLHPMDLSGYLMDVEPGEWEVISLPCIKEDGTALWPFKHTVEELRKIEAVNESVFTRQYMQQPRHKEGLLFPVEDLRFKDFSKMDLKKMAEYRFMIIDPADEGGDDLSAPECYLIGDKIYVPSVIYNNHGTDINEPLCVEKIVTSALDAVEIESNSAWILFAKSVRTLANSRHPNCVIRSIKNTINKHTRILAQASFIRDNFIFDSNYAKYPQYAKFIKNLTAYMKSQVGGHKNAHDDAPDALAGAAKYFRTVFAHLWIVPEKD